MPPNRINRTRDGRRFRRRPSLLVLAALVFALGAAWPFFRAPAPASLVLTKPEPTASAKLVNPLFSASRASSAAPRDEPDSPETLRRLAERDPAAAARWLATHPVPGERWPWLEQIALAWAERDPDAALAWARAEPAADLRSALLLGIAGELVRTRPLAALHTALETTASPARDQVLHRAVAEWAVRDAFAAAEWVWQVADDALRADLLSGLILTIAEVDPATAAIMAEDDLAPGRARDDVVVSVLQRWAQQDPEAALARLARLPSGPLKDAATRSLAFDVDTIAGH